MPFPRDNNSLNKEFYYELLYIMGLEEKKKGNQNNRKTIINKRKKNEPGALIELTINAIKDSKYQQLLLISNIKGKNEDEKIFTIALELVLTWINRILFLKFLEGCLYAFNKKNSKYIFLNKENIRNFQDLQDLFFKVISLSPEKRETALKKKFEYLPFLNSSIFEANEYEKNFIHISRLKEKNIRLFSSSLLKSIDNDFPKNSLPVLDYLFQFLSCYNFYNQIEKNNLKTDSIRENSEIKKLITLEKQINQKKETINSSTLGLIFEKINGYKQGSYFTPEYISRYMSKDSIYQTVIRKFNSKNGWKCTNISELKNKIENINRANTIINSIRICDPAVGSGHFLVSALNTIVEIKSILGILQDKNGNSINDYSVKDSEDELIIQDLYGNRILYEINETKSQIIQEVLFHEKRKIIESCLFGVDINQNSVNICRLRLWMELIKSSYYINPISRVKILQTLPNLDLNIKEGNSLISIYQVGCKFFQDNKADSNNLRQKIADYKEISAIYRYAKEEQEKNKLKVKINKLKSEILQNLDHNTEYNIPANQKKFEWCIEFPEILDKIGNLKGFDIIIGNPPYIYLRELDKNEKKYLKRRYSKYSDDLYMFFTYRALELLKPGGILAFIIPDTFFTLSTKTQFRKKLLSNANSKFIHSGFCFEDAYVETMIIIVSKTENTNKLIKNEIFFVPNPNDYEDFKVLKTFDYVFKNNIFFRLFYPTKLNIDLNERFNISLKKIVQKYENVFIGRMYNEKELQAYTKNLKSGDITLLGLISNGEQGLVTGNNSRYLGNVIYRQKLQKQNEIEQEIEEKFVNLLKKYGINVKYKQFIKNKPKYYDIAEQLKTKHNNPSLFGKKFLYKCIEQSNIKEFHQILNNEKNSGGKPNLWIYYHRGNKKGEKWLVPQNNCINWNKKYVYQLKNKDGTNSRWQGRKYYNNTGFAWIDYFTNEIKAFFIEEGPYSKNTVKLHTEHPLLSDKYILALLNSKFISYFTKNFISSTHTLQIKDGKLIPIKIPDKKTKEALEKAVDQIIEIIELKKESAINELEIEINRLVYNLYGLKEEEIDEIEHLFKFSDEK